MRDSVDLGMATVTTAGECPVDHRALAAAAVAADAGAQCPVDHLALAAAAVAADAGAQCPVDHLALAAAGAGVAEAPVDHAALVAADPAATCPVDHAVMAVQPGQCPVARPVDLDHLPPADRFMRRLLRIPDHPDRVRERDVQRLFSASITVSAIRCLLSYVVFPIVAPTVGAISRLGAFVGIPVGVVALIYDVRAVRRFWLANHRYRWPFTIIYAIVIVMVLTLFARDIRNLIV